MEQDKQIGTTEEAEMSFLDHLEILRWHLIRSVTVIMLASIGAFVFKGFIFDVIIFGPKQPDFITYQFLCSFSKTMSELVPAMFPNDAICIGQNLPNLVNLTMAGQFSAHIITSLVAGVIIAFPYILWEVWRFIKPGLQNKERNMARGFVASASFLFFCGVAFGYFVISPLSINFFLNYQVSDEVLNSPTLSTYISLITSVVIACGAVFELPIVVYFLTKAGLLTPQILKAFRRHAMVGALLLSAVITPPDVFSQILVSIPIMILYELSIRISRIVTKKDAA
ncbi:twin-arginine translocase subunit TatC [Salibacteraceae bacterium]|jgi:sec-independent protein translocase protein TatC|nr:twin-arginine translocase subunit TatC [Salibacteraceae bacterium]MDB9708385.1 twin-arginine translocase subunit TatC [Salibacteraceae bacterium]MDC1220325.1 twin-arginine translocase subunit TatC [bacterium]MDC1304636.1 twin-arginine translocase subunit TatC [Salibacteraceae bacterium]HAQ72039.1 twin-arginine translocase subunit TatC [Flavobacteriales bacterium]